MRRHRNPRPKVPKRPSTDNPRRPRPTRRQTLRATFERLVLENPRLAGAVLEVLEIVASVNRRRAMELIEALSAVVLHSPQEGAVRTRDEIEAELHKLGWKLTEAPTQVYGGWRATIQRGAASVSTVGQSAIGVLEDLLRHAEREGKQP